MNSPQVVILEMSVFANTDLEGSFSVKYEMIVMSLMTDVMK